MIHLPARRADAGARRSLRMARAAAMVLGVVAVSWSRDLAAQDTSRVRPTSRTITLQEAIRLALLENNTVRFAENNTLLDSLTVRQARNAYLPNLSATSSGSQRFLSRSQPNDFGVSASLGSNVTLYNGGINRNTLTQARQNLQAGGFDLGRTRQTIVFNVATEFLNLITQQEQLRVEQENLTAQEEELRQLQEFVNHGTRP